MIDSLDKLVVVLLLLFNNSNFVVVCAVFCLFYLSFYDVI